MMTLPVDREGAWELLCAHTKTEALRMHALCMEAAMRHFAEVYNEDKEWWGMAGLLHDLDYEEFPDQHCAKTKIMLEEAGFPQDFIRAIMCHGWGLCTDVEPVSQMEMVIYGADELTGFVIACARVRPSKSVMDLEVKSVKKKLATDNFAAAVKRDVIKKGADMLNLEMDVFINHVIVALRGIADDIGFGMAKA